MSVAVTGRRSAIRYEIRDSCLISFSVSFAKASTTLDGAREPAGRHTLCCGGLCGSLNGPVEVSVGADTNDVVPLRLVLIEDHQALREGLELLLDREGCEVVGTAGTAGEGRALIERLEPDVSLVDIRPGEESGIDLKRTLLDDDPAGRVVLYT